MKLGMVCNDTRITAVMKEILLHFLPIQAIFIVQPNDLSSQSFDYILAYEPTDKVIQTLKKLDSNTIKVIITENQIHNDCQFHAIRLTELYDYLSQQLKHKLLHCSYNGVEIHIMIDQIIVIRKTNTRTEIICDYLREPVIYAEPLYKLIKQLPEYFIFINRSEIINLHYVLSIDKDTITTKDNQQLYISRRRIAQVTRWFLQRPFNS